MSHNPMTQNKWQFRFSMFSKTHSMITVNTGTSMIADENNLLIDLNTYILEHYSIKGHVSNRMLHIVNSDHNLAKLREWSTLFALSGDTIEIELINKKYHIGLNRYG